MLPLAVPGMVLGLSYIFFFNNPTNPFNGIYGTMVILVLCTIVYFYTVPHLMAVTALKKIDSEFDAVGMSLHVPWDAPAGNNSPVPASAAWHLELSLHQCDDDGFGCNFPLFCPDQARLEYNRALE